ncbi:MAG: cytochrome family [Thermoleophilaceae bacterium]|jgi:cytochrome P450|nr:cytochrome family [Thermoleophilaceae bacterium]
MDVSLPPGPRGSSLSVLARYIAHPAEMFDDCAERCGDPFTLKVPGQAPVVVHSSPAAAKDIVGADPAVLRAGEGNRILGSLLGSRSVMLLDGDEHLAERRILLPPFHGARMRAYGDLMTAVTERAIAGWPAAREFAVGPSARGMALEIILRAVFGIEDEQRLERLGGKLRKLLDSSTKRYRVLSLFLMRPDGPTVRMWRRWSPEVRPIDRLLLDEIARRRAEPDVAERSDIMSMLIGSIDDDEAMRDELLTLLVAGHETTAIGLAWALARLARMPEVAERAASDDDYLDAVITETLRLHPVLTFSVVRAAAAPVVIDGHRYSAGVWHAICPYLMHKRADVYADPQEFRPERFLGESPGTYSWMPFGGGRRRCLGASFALFELRTILRTILNAGTLSAPGPQLERPVRRGFTFAPADGGRITFVPARAAATERQRPYAAA